jgi:hypothetical protein
MTPAMRRYWQTLALVASAGTVAALGACYGSRSALITTSYEQTYYPASHNWVFRRTFPSVDHLFNGFDYGHAITYETLVQHPTDAAQRLEGAIFADLTGNILRHPPRLAVEERPIAPAYTSLVPEVAMVFDWAHMLHRQLYDVLADTRRGPAVRDAEVREVLRYYRSRRDLALSSAPKNMDLMNAGPYALAFRRYDPKFSGLLWSYHWLQLVLYDALLADSTKAARTRNVDAVVAHFWTMLAAAPANMPTVMPMAAAVSPRFSTAYPEAAIIFDNLHSLHDVVGDILASPHLSPRQCRALILAAAAAYRDSTRAITSREEWREMARSMGVEHMGGPAMPWLPNDQPR